MSDRQLKLKTTETAGSRVIKSTTINNINPEAAGADMLTFAKKLNAFTTNVYVQTDMVDTYNLDTEEIPSPTTPKTQATITAPSTFAPPSGTITVDWTSDYTGKPFVTSDDDDATFSFEGQKIIYATGLTNGKVVKVMIPETENYTAAMATINIVTS